MASTTNASCEMKKLELRWPVALTILAVLFLTVLLHDRVKLFPDWFHYAAGSIVLASMFAVPLTGGKARWLRVERLIILLFFIVMEAGVLVGLARLISQMVSQSHEIDGLRLLTSSIAIWINNILMFSLLYWQLDRDGPEARMNNTGIRPDWLFPQVQAPEDALPNWRPTFIDYLFLAYTTATAFSPTDALPLTSRAKLLMMLESAISLTTIVVVASRAINILGS